MIEVAAVLGTVRTDKMVARAAEVVLVIVGALAHNITIIISFVPPLDNLDKNLSSAVPAYFPPAVRTRFQYHHNN